MQLGTDVSERDQVCGSKSEDSEPFLILYEDEQSGHRLVRREGPGRSEFTALPKCDEGARLRWCDPSGADSPLLLPDTHDSRLVVAVLFFDLDDGLRIARSWLKVKEALERVKIHSRTVLVPESGIKAARVIIRATYAWERNGFRCEVLQLRSDTSRATRLVTTKSA
jgi:hypothetical protein